MDLYQKELLSQLQTVWQCKTVESSAYCFAQAPENKSKQRTVTALSVYFSEEKP